MATEPFPFASATTTSLEHRNRSIFDLPANFFDSCRLVSPSLTSVFEPLSISENFSPGKQNIIDDSEEKGSRIGGVAVPRWTCNICKTEFDSLQDQRSHFKSDIHRFNVKLSIAGKDIVKEEDFDELTMDSFKDYEVSSISGSEDEADKGAYPRSDAPKGSIENIRQKLFIRLQTGERVSIWKSLILNESESVSYENDGEVWNDNPGCLRENEVIERLRTLILEPRDNMRFRIVLLSSGGHFAGCVFHGNSVVAHKTFHRYVVRAKAGKKQSSKDATGKAAHSAGAALRRHNELALKKEIQELLTSWKSYFDASSCVFIHSPSSNRNVLFIGDKPYFSHQFCAVRNVPLTVRRPTLKEAKRIYNHLTQVAYEVEKEIPPGTQEDLLLSSSSIIGNGSRDSCKEGLEHNLNYRDASKIRSIDIKSDNILSESDSDNEIVCTSTPLHEAAQSGDAQKVLELLEQGLDPCIKDERGRTPYMLANEKEVRNTFRRFMASNLEKWDWNSAKVPSALTKEMEESQAAKQAEKDSKRKARAKELKKLRRAREKKAQAESAQSQNTVAASQNRATIASVSKGQSQPVGVLRISKEEELKRAQDIEREKRAAAAERRLAEAAAAVTTRNARGSSSTTVGSTSLQSKSGVAGDISCSCCNASLAGKVPFHRNGTGSHKGTTKPVAASNPSNIKSSSFKSRLPPSSNHSPGSATLRRSSSASFTAAAGGADGVPGRVRVAVRLRPRNAEELVADADFADCVELQPELKRLKLRKNNWDSETYEFDEVLTEFASQKRVYEVVAKPVVESVLDGYNGTVMAYGQTGTGKTFTLGRLGEEDTSARGIMVRSMEDILENVSPETDSVSVSYLQLYMETIQDLIDPANDNISIVEDPKTGDVSLPGATHVEIRNEQSFLELLRIGEAHRIAANTKLNTESSRSHAILMVQVKRLVLGAEDVIPSETDKSSHFAKPQKPLVRKSKLVLLDLAGSERIHKSGSEGHMLEEAKSINLSLSALGKCINALAENSAHVPVRDSKLTRLLRDSFGGTARTSLIVTIGPSPRHRGETASTILFGQRAMKVENMLRIKEEFDYKSLARRLEIQLDKLIAENERQQKAFDDEVERINLEAQSRVSEVERNFADALEKERLKCQMEYMESVKKLEEKMIENQRKHGCHGFMKDECNGEGPGFKVVEDVAEVKKLLEKEIHMRKKAEEEVKKLKSQQGHCTDAGAGGDSEILKLQKALEDEVHHKNKLEEEMIILRSQMLQLTFEAEQMRRCLGRSGSTNAYTGLDSPVSQVRDSLNGHKTPVAALFEQVGLQKILALLESEDANVRIHAVKVVANLAAEEANQERIVEAGGLTSLLMLLRSYEDETVRRVVAGAIANLAMNEANQELIMVQGGIGLLSMTASDAEDPQTLRMVAGAIANLCGNDKLQATLRSEGGIKALLGMVRCGHPDVLSQVARGIANFAKCESRATTNGTKSGRSLLIEDGALPWIVQNANNDSAPIRRHIELALCHLAQHEVNAKDLISGGALWELVRISRDCSREDIRSLARRTLNLNPVFRAEMRRLRIEL